MYFITNRAFDDSKKDFKKLTKHPNAKGPNELSAVLIEGVSKPSVKLLDDRLEEPEVIKLKKEFNLNLDSSDPHYASLRVACNVFRQARKACKSVVIFVHGYNNDIKDVYASAREIERLYNVIVVPFTWPANGGGALSGTLSYLADKRDARASEDALNRFINIVGYFHGLLTEATRSQLASRASEKHPDNPTKQREYLSQLLEKYCDVSVSLLCHSMGNYVLKHALTSSLAESRKLVFDNVILAAADTNNFEHTRWVEALRARKQVFVLINENDYALSWSRRKPGEEQKARLGHYLRKLTAGNAFYVDFTREKAVNKSHSYFDGRTVLKNKSLKRFFEKIFSAKNVMPYLEYEAHNNTYRPK